MTKPFNKTILTIAGFDPSLGAGLTADLSTIAAHGCFGVSAVTALTVQSTLGVRAVQPVGSEWLRETLDDLTADLPPDAIKIGMIATAGNVKVTAAFLRRFRERKPGVVVVLDPVMRSSSGRELLDAGGIEALKAELMPQVDWVTPNWAELGLLVGEEIATAEMVEEGSQRLAEKFPGLSVVATGGDTATADDLVTSSGSQTWLRGEKIESTATHGTGCAFSTALACELANGMAGLSAAEAAKAYVAEGIRRAAKMGAGRGPLDLLWPLREV